MREVPPGRARWDLVCCPQDHTPSRGARGAAGAPVGQRVVTTRVCDPDLVGTVTSRPRLVVRLLGCRTTLPSSRTTPTRLPRGSVWPIQTRSAPTARCTSMRVVYREPCTDADTSAYPRPRRIRSPDTDGWPCGTCGTTTSRPRP